MKLLEALATTFVLDSGNVGYPVLLPRQKQERGELFRIRFKKHPSPQDVSEVCAWFRSQGVKVRRTRSRK